MSAKILTLAILVALVCSPVSAEDTATKKKKRKNNRQRGMATQISKRFEPIKFTKEQTEKIEVLGKAADTEASKIREQAGITGELMKERGKIQRSMKDSDKKGKELFAAINQQAGLNDKQIEALKSLNQLRAKMQKEVIAMLSEEQRQALPERLQRLGKKGQGKKGQGKKKKKKNNAA